MSIFSDHLTTIECFIENEGTHPTSDVQVTCGRDFATDSWILAVCCHACGRTWVLRMNHPARDEKGYQEAVRDEVAPFLGKVVRAACFRITLEAELAEWITEMVADAMPLGVTYGQILDSATRQRLCAPSDVDIVLDRLGFPGYKGFWVPDRSMWAPVRSSNIRLPEGHPLHPESTPATFDFDWRT